MLRSNVISCEQCYEWCRTGRLLNMGPSPGFLPFHQAEHAGDLKTELARYLDGLDGRRSRGADVVDDHHARRLLAEALDALARAMRLFCFAHQKP